MQGIMLVDKPKGWTSFDAVNYVRKMIATAEGIPPKRVKVGHTGTLDPLATGLLVLLVGKDYTRRAGEFSKLDKTYEAEMKIGQTSTTGDGEGEKTDVSAYQPSRPEVAAALADFTGKIMQVPPAFSAIKVKGRRAYELARAGQTAELEARPVEIFSCTLRSYDYPFIRFAADVSSGTYIRSLVTDVGEALKTGAYLSNLRRTRVGKFSVEDAVPPERLSPDTIGSYLKVAA